MGNCVVFVIVTPRAIHGQPQESGSEGLDPVGAYSTIHSSGIEPFRIDSVVAVVTGCHLGHEVPVGKKIPRHLLKDKTVERHVVVEGPDDPVPPNPHVTYTVVLVSVGIGITGRIQPIGRNLFPVVGEESRRSTTFS